ncbi:putative receptor-like protein kinase At5g39000 isoform X3 [Lactuca sativa]|nr:putative receptor-like protein kinase At5g39000 isoform X3 [Lactuca sativa]XP_023754029.1 putative receptor-like protein kinase At5g39000 isoform X3 [Lactuca sativa]XP_023754030.1 putative receptor-like protein kinase At5g39000 isoform X3 [Lactuca sativa]XP_042756289.1 putative receptor-like protein kinase At5g39000 isoform X3 [Lactuca sativa]
MIMYPLPPHLRELRTKDDVGEVVRRCMKNIVVVKGPNNAVIIKDLQGRFCFNTSLSELNEARAMSRTKQEIEVLNRLRQLILESDLKVAITKFQQSNDPKIPLHVINDCTHSFNEKKFIGKGGYGRVYKGILTWANHINKLVAVKRLDVTGFQGNKEFHTEVTMLSEYRHKNIITLIGYCDDNEEKILVYEYASHGSLDKYLSGRAMSGGLSWLQLLKICIGIASALDYLHNNVAEKHRIIHRDVKSANVLLDENWNAKLSDFGLARIGLANQHNTFVITNIAGTHGYCDPQYERTGFLTKESDVYSFGVVLFEVLCGRLACILNYHDERRFLHHWARTHYKNGELDKIINQRIKTEINPRTLSKFSAIAYQCLHKTREQRPTIAEIAFQLGEAWKIQFTGRMIKGDETFVT